MTYAGLLNMTCTIGSKSAGIGSSSGGNTWTDAVVGTGIACTVQADTSEQAQRAMAETGIRHYRVYLPFGQSVLVGYRISSISGAAFSNLVLEVIGPPIDHSGRGIYAMVPAKAITADTIQ